MRGQKDDFFFFWNVKPINNVRTDDSHYLYKSWQYIYNNAEAYNIVLMIYLHNRELLKAIKRVFE